MNARILALCGLLACTSADEPVVGEDTDAPLPGALPIAGPGLGNLAYGAGEAFTVVGRVDQESGAIPANDPDAPITFGRPYGTNVVAMHDGYLVVVFAPDSGVGPGGIVFVDVSDPRAPVVVNRLYEPKGRTSDVREAHSLGFSQIDGRKYMAIATGRGVEFWDLTDVMAPVQVSKLALPGVFFGDYGAVAWQLFWQGRHLYVASAEQGVFVVDATDPAAPVLSSRAGPNPIPPSELGGFRVGPIFAVGSHLVLTSMDNQSGYAMLDVSDPVNPALVSVHSKGSRNAYAYCLGGGLLVNANRGAGAAVTMHDVRDPLAVRTYDTSLTVSDQLYCATQDDHVFLGCQDEVVRVDVSDPSAPVVQGRGGLDRHDADHGQVTPLGNLVYVGNDHGTGSGMIVHDTAPDTTPPVVRWASPADGEAQVSVTARVGLVFSDNLTIEHVHHQSLRLLDASGRQVRGRFTVQQNIVNFAPDLPLAADADYTVEVVADGLTDWSGNPAPAWTSQFHTASDSTGDAIPGLVAHWPLDEGWGDRVADRSGTGNHGTRQGGGGFTADALQLDGRSGTVEIEAPKLPPDGDLTVSLWLRADTTPDLPSAGAWDAGAWVVDAAAGTSGWAITLGEGRVSAFLGGTDVVRSAGAIDDGAWHHVVLHRRSSGRHTLAVDGVGVDQAGTPPRPALPPSVWLGSRDGDDGFAGIELRDVRLYAADLDGDAVARLADGTDEGVSLRARLDPVAGEVGAPITLALRTAGPGDAEVRWAFGDGSASEARPDDDPVTHTWSAPGHYEVTASVTNGVQRAYATALVTVHRPLPTSRPTHTSTVAIDDAGRRVWVVHRDHDLVSEIDLDTLDVIAEHPTCHVPATVAVSDAGEVVVGCEDGLWSWTEGEGGSFWLDDTDAQVALFAPDGAVWSASVGRQDLRRGVFGAAALADRAVLPGRVGGLAVSADGARLFATRFLSPDAGGELYSVSATTGAVDTWALPVDTTTVDGEDRARGVPNYLSVPALTPDGAELWIPAKQDNIQRGLWREGRAMDFESTVRSVVLRVDARTGEELPGPRLDLNNRAPAVDIAFSPLGDWAFVVVQGSHEVQILDAYSGEPVGGLPDAGFAPDGAAVSADGARVFVHGFLSRSVVVYDTADLVGGRAFAARRVAEIATPSAEVLDPVVLRGKRIFYDAADPRMSRDGYLSCAVCHLHGADDGRVWDFTERSEGLRNTHDLRGRAGMGHGPVHWTANFDEIQDFENDIRGFFGGRGFLADLVFQAGTRSDPLGDPKAGLSADLDALAAYVSSLDTPAPSPFRGLDPEAEARGAVLFDDLACADCHGGESFTDSGAALHDVGTITTASGSRRGAPLTGFDTPTLRGVWASPPYLHDGSADTLRDVLVGRNPTDDHGGLSVLDDAAVDDLIVFLRALD